MPLAHPIYRDIFIDKGANFSQKIELSVPFEDYDFEGYIKSSYTSTTSVPIAFAPVDNEPNKAIISVTDEHTRLLRRKRGIYDIFATNKESGEIHKEREGTAHYNESTTNDPGVLPPPPGFQITLIDVIDAGSAASADIEDFATAGQGALAETALQPEVVRHDFVSNLGINYLGRAPFGSLESDVAWIVTRITIALNGSAVSDSSLTLIAWTDRANPLNYN
jgi:hypothetical protein